MAKSDGQFQFGRLKLILSFKKVVFGWAEEVFVRQEDFVKSLSVIIFMGFKKGIPYNAL